MFNGIQLVGVDSEGNLLLRGPGVCNMHEGDTVSINFELYRITRDPYETDDGMKVKLEAIEGFSSNGKPLTKSEVQRIANLNKLLYQDDPGYLDIGLHI